MMGFLIDCWIADEVARERGSNDNDIILIAVI